MLVYPQLATGALSQFPVQKRRRLRTVVNTSLDGRAIKLADPGAEITEWQLAYAGLTDDEAAALQQFFAAAEGTLNGFTFLDPTGNLFAWSDQLDNAAWAAEPFLSMAGGIADPAGGTNAWHLTNSGAGAQNISQTLSAPAGYVYCFSVFARSPQLTAATLLHGSNRANRNLGTDWSRITFDGQRRRVGGIDRLWRWSCRPEGRRMYSACRWSRRPARRCTKRPPRAAFMRTRDSATTSSP